MYCVCNSLCVNKGAVTTKHTGGCQRSTFTNKHRLSRLYDKLFYPVVFIIYFHTYISFPLEVAHPHCPPFLLFFILYPSPICHFAAPTALPSHCHYSVPTLLPPLVSTFALVKQSPPLPSCHVYYL